MSMGAVRTYENALKAFRRGCHQFPSCWRAAVVCNSTAQADTLFEDTLRMLDASSIEVFEANRAGWQIKVSKGCELRFLITDHSLCDRIRGVEFPQIIVAGGLSDQMKECLQARNRHTYVDEKYTRWDDVYL